MAFFDNVKFPFFTLQELNLDWLLREVKRIAGFMPQNGNVGDILTRKSDGAAWEPPEAVNINIDGLPQDTQIMDNDQLIFYDISAQANRKIKPPDLLDSMCSNGTPLMNGTAAAGTSKKPARYDHVHPVDTSRAPASYFQNSELKIANGGTGAGDAATARANLGLGSVATENIVPVTMGGTGANNGPAACTSLGIVEGPGYIKFANGTLIQWGSEANHSDGDQITFPIAFHSAPAAILITPSYNSALTARCIFSVAGATSTGANVYSIDCTTGIASTSNTLAFRWVAIGTWN